MLVSRSFIGLFSTTFLKNAIAQNSFTASIQRPRFLPMEETTTVHFDGGKQFCGNRQENKLLYFE